MTALERRTNAATAIRPKVLVLYHHDWMHVKTVAHHLESFHRFSRYDVSYVSSLAKCRYELDCFSAVVLHYTARVCHPGHIAKSWLDALRRYDGLKVLFLQDEYENVHLTWRTIADLELDVVFTCVPEESIAKVYPPEKFPRTKFVNVLTGYVPLDFDAIPPGPPMSERKTLIGYRGRNLGYWYGDLGQEKAEIGKRMKQACRDRGLACDIGWDESDRIYGDDWFRFLGSCRATLGTESGANVFDWDGSLRDAIQRDLLRNPDAGYEEIRERHFAGRDGEVPMNQISPKLFEAIACRTGLILFEGTYSGVLEPNRHFIPLKKDFSNVDDVLNKVQDVGAMQTMTQRTYDEIVMSGCYSYRAFIELVDRAIEPLLEPAKAEALTALPLPTCDALTAFRKEYAKNYRAHLFKRMWSRLPVGMRERLKPWIGREAIKNLWIRAPKPIRSMLDPLVGYTRSLLKQGH
jgi:hypothetical protein